MSLEQIFLDSLLEVLPPLIKMVLAPIFLWIMLPGLITQLLFKQKQAYSIGAFLGLIGMFTIGPYGN